jgi:hypothetical protein
VSPIAVDGVGPPGQSPLTGGTPGLAVKALVQRLADGIGYQVANSRFRAAAITWIQDTLLEIQLADPKLRRTLVMDAPFTLVTTTDTYDVRTDFGWSNCYAVDTLKFPDIQDRVLEAVTPEQYRNRGILPAEQGPPIYFVKLDQFRIKIVPPADQAYSGIGDYQQDIPQIANDDDRVDWPRAWDIVLQEGCLFRGYRWRNEQDQTWVRQRAVFRDLLGSLKSGEAVLTRTPGKVVVTRARQRGIIPHDNSADIRWRR